MKNPDPTLTSPLADVATEGRPLLGLTIVWHPDLDRVGEQCIGTSSDGVLELSRFLPLFKRPQSDGISLGHGGISRAALKIVRNESDAIEIQPPASRMVVEINGIEIYEPIRLAREQVDAGVVLGLGRAVYICLHWMFCLPKNNTIPGFLGVGNAAIKTRELIRQAANGESPVLLLGETGTGKEVAASAIHALGKRANEKLVCVNMAALNESLAAADLFGAQKGAYTGSHTARNGLFAEADRSTLFLDEIGNAPTSVQPMLLRVLENGEYRPLGAQRDQRSTARLIAATDQDLYNESFNQALLRRLEGFIIHIPPLRARREDIGVLIVNLIRTNPDKSLAEVILPPPLISQFLNYDWPGNIRQLSHVLKRALLALQLGDLPAFDSLVDRSPVRITDSGRQIEVVTEQSAHPKTKTQVRRKLTDISEQEVLDAMQAHHWYIQGAAHALGISRPSMYKLLEAHSQIRRAEDIPEKEIRQSREASAGDLEKCAALLMTPVEGLRRHIGKLI
jgi:DNA-binding NtrC family response regulator